MASQTSPVWFITGCSTGFGRELAKLVLARGWRAVVTARDRARVADLARDAGDRALATSLDVTDPRGIAATVQEAETRFGGIDVLVNNAGYGYQASVEEGDEAEIRAQFDANVFGLFAMTRAVLPGMRARRRGHILNITSVAGFIGFPGSGYYAASKHAVEGRTRWRPRPGRSGSRSRASSRGRSAPTGPGARCGRRRTGSPTTRTRPALASRPPRRSAATSPVTPCARRKR